MSRVSDRGVALYSHAGAHVIVDVAGWFTGAAAVATTPPPVNASPTGATEVIFVSDSSFAGIRWNGALGLLQGAAFDSRLESCRRLIGTSCRGREGYAPRTAEGELATATPGRYRMAIIAVGYNDSSFTFGSAFESVIAMARSKGIDRVMWMTYRENVGYVSPAGVSDSDSFVAMNRSLRSAAASGRYPELIIADWHTYSFAEGVLADLRRCPLHRVGRSSRGRVCVAQARRHRATAVPSGCRWAFGARGLVRRS